MTTDFRAELQRLIDAIDAEKAPGIDASESCHKAVYQARMALNQNALAESVEPVGEGVSDDVTELVAAMRGTYRWSTLSDDQLDRAADLLAHYSPPPAPVAVGERLPGDKDCAPRPDDPDATPWCWAGKEVDGSWEWVQLSMLGIGTNTLGRIIAGGGWTHWQPHDAISTPEAQS